nr:hypothetical protein GCM10017745_24770 [Saccharothrix mutabilis subsp. capreolus]
MDNPVSAATSRTVARVIRTPFHLFHHVTAPWSPRSGPFCFWGAQRPRFWLFRPPRTACPKGYHTLGRVPLKIL